MTARTLFALSGAATLAGCALFNPPEPRERVEAPELPAVYAVAGEAPEPSPVALDWWREFGDPRLDALVDAALASNYDLLAAVERLAQADAQAELAGAGRRPQVNAGLNVQRQRQVLVGIPIPGTDGPLAPTFTQYGLSLDVSWELDLWGRLAAAQEAGELEAVAAAVDLFGARLSIAGQLTKAYLAATEAQLQVAVAEEGVAARDRSLELVRERFAAGLAPRLEVDQARAELSGAEAQLAARRRAAEGTLRQVELLLGRYPGATLELPADLPSPPAEVPGGLPAEILSRRPDLVAAERRLRAADRRFDAARADRYPRLSLTASGGTVSDQLEDLTDGDFRVWSIGGNLVQPLFQGGRIRANIALADAVAAEAAARYADTVLRAAAEVEIALDGEADLAAQVGHLRDAYEAAAAAEEQVDERYRAGLENLLQVLLARRTRLEAESAWLDARRAWLDNRVDLYLALGGGFEFEAATGGSGDEHGTADQTEEGTR